MKAIHAFIQAETCLKSATNSVSEAAANWLYIYVWLTLTAGSGSRPTLSWWSAASRSSRASASSRAGRRSEIYSHDITAESVVDEDSTWVLIVLSESCNYKTLIWAATWLKCFLFFFEIKNKWQRKATLVRKSKNKKTPFSPSESMVPIMPSVIRLKFL